MSFKHVGKKVETSEIRLDKNVFFEKAKSVLGFKRLVIDSQGRANNEIIGRRAITLGDNDDALTAANFTNGGIFKITPNLSSGRTLEISAGTGVTLVGNMITAVSSSSRFQLVKTDTAAVELYRLA